MCSQESGCNSLRHMTYLPSLPLLSSSLKKKEPIISNLFDITRLGVSPPPERYVLSLSGLGHETLDSGECSQGGGGTPL